MKSIVTTTNTTEIKNAFQNKFGMITSNTPEIRDAVASYAKSLVAKLHEERNKSLNNKALD